MTICISQKLYNQKTGLALFCPITSHIKGYPFEVVLSNHSINGCILSDQVKNLDFVQRNCSFIEKASADEINSVIEKTEGIEYEIFVVDNASNDGSIEAIENQFPNINIIKSEINGGFGYANNLAIKQAKGKYILCLNTDTLLVNNAIKISLSVV